MAPSEPIVPWWYKKARELGHDVLGALEGLGAFVSDDPEPQKPTTLATTEKAEAKPIERPLFADSVFDIKLPTKIAYLDDGRLDTQEYDPILRAFIEAESRGIIRAKNKSGASGHLQLMPDTYGAKAPYTTAIDPFDPLQANERGVAHLQWGARNSGVGKSIEGAAAVYNAGLGRVRKAINKAGSNEYSKYQKYLPGQTTAYVKKILELKKKYEDEAASR